MKKKIVVCFLTLLTSISIFATGCGKQEQITSSEYIAGKDDQTCLDGYRDVATSENGYYFLSNSFVYFYDSNSKKTHVLCNKPECAHDGEGCNAYINAMQWQFGIMNMHYIMFPVIRLKQMNFIYGKCQKMEQKRRDYSFFVRRSKKEKCLSYF